MSTTPQILRPIPRRTFEISPASAESSAPPSPAPDNTNAELLEAKLHGASPPSRTRSILNLTSSTLLGIYSPTAYDTPRGEPFPLSETGVELSSQRQSGESPRPAFLTTRRDANLPPAAADRRKSNYRVSLWPFLSRSLLLFIIGVAHCILIAHLHDHQKLAPVEVEAFDRHSWKCLTFWGLAAVGLGSLQPWLDRRYSGSGTPHRSYSSRLVAGTGPGTSAGVNDERRDPGAYWTPVVRSIGAFVGITFAIRKLPWQSTSQVSLTLALVNPVLWYLIDRSKPGFILSAIVGVAGTLILSELNPNLVPPPAMHDPTEMVTDTTAADLTVKFFVSKESLGTYTWLASVLFCSCVCFGNIGRKIVQGQQNTVS